MSDSSLRLRILVLAVLLAAASPAFAQGLGDIIVAKLTTLMVVLALASFAFQVGFVYAGARFLGIGGSVLHAVGAVLLGGFFAVAFAFAASFAVFAMPPAVQGIVVSSVATVGGALGIKLVFSSPFPKALLLYIVALTANSIAVALTLIVIY